MLGFKLSPAPESVASAVRPLQCYITHNPDKYVYILGGAKNTRISLSVQFLKFLDFALVILLLFSHNWTSGPQNLNS